MGSYIVFWPYSMVISGLHQITILAIFTLSLLAFPTSLKYIDRRTHAITSTVRSEILPCAAAVRIFSALLPNLIAFLLQVLIHHLESEKVNAKRRDRQTQPRSLLNREYRMQRSDIR